MKLRRGDGSAWSLAGPAAALLACAATLRDPQDEKQPPAAAAPPRYQDAAKLEQHEQMLADKRGSYGPADGGGSARVLEQPDPPPRVSSPARYLLEYAAGPLGIARGGAIFFQVSPFWNWTTPVPIDADTGLDGGNTLVTCDAPGVRLECETAGPGCLAIRFEDAPLPAGGRVRIEYGAAPASGTSLSPVRVDRFAEKEEAFYFWVDGDGDGSRRLIAEDPHVEIAPGPAVDLVVTATSEVAPGGELDVTIAFLDASANAATGFAGEVELSGDGLELPARVEFLPEHRGRRRVQGRALAPGVRFAVARVGGAEAGRESNPILVSEQPRRVLWADLHGHSSLSDGTGTPEDYYRYAREVAGLDVAVLTDHDHWGMLFLDDHPAIWEANVAAARRAGAAGRFLALPGFEWTSWIHGHRHVVFFGETARIFSSIDERFDTPEELWTAIEGAQALSIPHHPAGGPIALDWSRVGHPTLEPLIEICSAHGSSEAPDGVRPIYDADEGSWVRSALERGLRAGLVASGDGHDGHPGLAHLGPHYPTGGLAAILADEPSAPRVLEALRARRVYATSGPRILLRFALGRARMGEVVSPAPAGAIEVYARAVGTAGLASVDLIRGGKLAARSPGQGRRDLELAATVADLRPGEFLYVRVLQEDGHGAWSSPIWIE
jgi:hypothetical protein